MIESGIAAATLGMRESGSLRIIQLPYLIALKLYAGGMKSKADIVELLPRNAAADRDHIRGMCRQYRPEGLEPLMREAAAAGNPAFRRSSTENL